MRYSAFQRRWIRRLSGTLLCAASACTSLLHADIDWPSYGGDPWSRKYSTANQITPENVKSLQVAWQWHSPDNDLVARNPALTPWTYKVTPIKVGNRLYASTSLGFVVALEASTGREIWRFDTGSWKAGRPTNLGFNHRGVSWWSDGRNHRIFMPTNDARLWSLDAETGRSDPAFGDGGVVDLTQGLGRYVERKHYSVMSAPSIFEDMVIVGPSIFDGPTHKLMPPGHVRAFDVRTGKQRWIFNTIPQEGEFGVETWENESWKYSGNTNVWTLTSIDPQLGYIYLPTGTPTNDWYGGHRHGDNLFAESLVCLDVRTGKRVWHFQMVHHGLWDYDLPAAPNLIDVIVDGRPVKAVAQVSKQGFIYVFDRVTGKPVWPIEERPVPQSAVPGERTSPTQPFPTRPAPFETQGISDETLVNFTPEIHAAAKQIVDRYDHGALFTPPSLRGTINVPAWGGGANWFGAAFDPETGLYYVPSSAYAMVVKLAEPEPGESDFRYTRSWSVNRVDGPGGLPLLRPPYGRISAVDMNSGEYRWQVPHGDGPRHKLIKAGIADPGPVGGMGTGPLLTKSLLFLGQDDNGKFLLRAFDKATGSVIAEIPMPSAPTGTPMTYTAGDRQYIALASGSGKDARIVAVALPTQ